MQHWLLYLGLAACLFLGCNSPSRRGDGEAADSPPPAPREFRAVWVATVSNIDWPSKPGLPTEEQQREALAILDKCKDLNLNAVILQVRPAADALYESKLEPWSYYLTGQQGKAPEPYYDPLKFWVDEAHKRGLELHAWFNPYRARHGGAKYATAAGHVSKSKPQIVRTFNNWEWLDPAEQGAQDQTYEVFLDVVRRYDVDGIHIDDYFYPYPDYLTKDKVVSDFPDTQPWQRYQQSGGKLKRDDWRRENVDQLIKRIYEGTKQARREVKFGISPFGIGQPGLMPKGISGFNQFEKLYANAERWLNEGWLDYWTPQLYWKTTATSQPYAGLLEYWVSQNYQKRHVWPGLFTSRVGDAPASPPSTRPAQDPWTAKDIVEQIEVTRRTPGAGGVVHFSMKVLMQNRGGVSEALKNGPYAAPALVPASPWLDDKAPDAPRAKATRSRLTWTPGEGEQPFHYAVWARYADGWRFFVQPGSATSMDLADESGALPSAVCISAVDRCGNESKRVLSKLPG